MIKAESDKVTENEKSAAPKQDETAGSSAQTESQKLNEEAELYCGELEQFMRRYVGEVPKAAELGEIRAHQAAVRNLVHRASALGGESSEKWVEITAERDKYKDVAQRSRADFLNYQTRSAKDLERAEELSLRGYVSDLLPVLDSFQLALQDAQSETADPKRVREALEMIATSLQQVLAVRGLTRIEAAGEPFDPTIHEAVAKMPADPEKGQKPNTVLEELRPGYLWKGLILRPAQVLVADNEKIVS